MASESPIKKILRALLRWVGYPAFFVLALLVFAYWTFPWQRLADRIEYEVEFPKGADGVRHPSGYRLDIRSLAPSGISGVTADGVTLSQVSDAPEELPLEVQFNHLEAHVGLFSLLFGDLALDFEAVGAGGEIEGEVSLAGNDLDLDLHIDDIILQRAALLRAFFPLPLRGHISGDIVLALREEADDSAGEIQLDLSGIEIGDGRAKLAFGRMTDGLTIPQLAAGTVVVRGTVDQGALQISRLEGRGDDLDLDAEGQLVLASPLNRSRLSLLLRADFKESYRERDDRTRALFSLLDLDPQGRAARTPDDALQFRIGGALNGRVSAQPAGRATPPASAPRRPRGGAEASAMEESPSPETE